MFDLQQPFSINADPQFKRGILMLDEAEGTCHWTGSGDGADFVVDYHVDAAIFGTKGLLIQTRSTTPAEDDQVAVVQYVTFPETDLLITRFRIRIPTVSTVKRFTVHTQFHDGTNLLTAGIGYNNETHALSYYNAAGGWTGIDGYTATTADGFTSIMELILDQANKNYLSVLFKGLRTDLSGLSFYTSAASTLKDLYIQFLLDTAGAAQAEIHLDSIYVGELEQL